MQYILVIGVPLLFVIGIAVSAIYVDARLRTSFGLNANKKTAMLAIAVVTMLLIMIILTATSASKNMGYFYVVGGYLFTFYIFLLLMLVFFQLLKLVKFPSNPITGILSIVFAIIITVIGAINARSFSITSTEIKLKNLSSDLNVVQLSDVHLGHHRGADYLSKIVQETNQLKPDFILITGDLVDADVALSEDEFRPLKKLQAPVYYVGGNHENEIDTDKTLQLIHQNGVNILHNQSVETHGVQLIGLNYMKADDKTIDLHPSNQKQSIQSVMNQLDISQHQPTILMHHSPVGIEYIADKKIDLMLAGHTHAGQVFPATWIAKYVFPFNQGVYRIKDTQVFVSQGAGTFMLPIRLGAKNEINFIQLKAE